MILSCDHNQRLKRFSIPTSGGVVCHVLFFHGRPCRTPKNDKKKKKKKKSGVGFLDEVTKSGFYFITWIQYPYVSVSRKWAHVVGRRMFVPGGYFTWIPVRPFILADQNFFVGFQLGRDFHCFDVCVEFAPALLFSEWVWPLSKRYPYQLPPSSLASRSCEIFRTINGGIAQFSIFLVIWIIAERKKSYSKQAPPTLFNLPLLWPWQPEK